ncbi:transcriptional regulator NanR [compost metagenome]
MEFHIRIAKISGNPIFVGVSEAMLAWLREYHTHMLIWTGEEKYTLVEHEEIIDMLATKNSDGAEAAMLHHLERSRALYTK